MNSIQRMLPLLRKHARFSELIGAGYTAAVRTGSGTSELVRNFDPAANETLFFPRLRGG